MDARNRSETAPAAQRRQAAIAYRARMRARPQPGPAWVERGGPLGRQTPAGADLARDGDSWGLSLDDRRQPGPAIALVLGLVILAFASGLGWLAVHLLLA